MQILPSSLHYTFQEPISTHQRHSNNNNNILGYESDGGNTSTDETSDEFITSLDPSPPDLHRFLDKEGAFGTVVRNDDAGGEMPFEDPPDIISLDDVEENVHVGDYPASNMDSSSVFTELTDPNITSSPFEDGWTAFESNIHQHQRPAAATATAGTTTMNQVQALQTSAKTTSTSHSNHTGRNNNKQSAQQKKEAATANEWDTPPWRSKSARLISPSPSSKEKLVSGNGPAFSTDESIKDENDSEAWGTVHEFSPVASASAATTRTTSSPQAKAAVENAKPSTSLIFGDNFFEHGFDDSELFQDNQFFHTWANDNDGIASNKKSQSNHSAAAEAKRGFNNDIMWETSSQFFEEKKDEQVFHSTASSPSDTINSNLKSIQGTTVVPVTPQRDTTTAAAATAYWSSYPTNTESFKQDVILSFDEWPTVSSSSSSRNHPNHKGVLTMTSGQTSVSTRTTATTTQQQQPLNDESSLASKQQVVLQRSQSRSSKKGGGSVGSIKSNSSAVDQILEGYRQKRQMKQQQQQGGWNAIVQNNAGNNNLPPPNNNISHKRTPSNESLSRTIGHLEKSIAWHNQKGNAVAATASVSSAASMSKPPQQTPQPSYGRASPGRSSPQSSVGFKSVANSNTNSNSISSATYQQPNLNAAVNEISDRLRVHRTLSSSHNNPPSDSDQFLLSNLEATIGPCGVAPDMESLSGRSSLQSHRQHSGLSSPRTHMHRSRGDASVDSRTSRNSFRSYRSNISQSALSQMSKESQSVAHDLFRMEAQLAEVARLREQPLEVTTTTTATSSSSANEESFVNHHNHRNTIIGAEPVPRPSLVEVVAPSGKLGILLANKVGTQGPTHVSAVRSESVLAGKVHVGDRFVSIDGEDVSRMNSREITSIMARKAEFQRVIVFVPVQMSHGAQDWI